MELFLILFLFYYFFILKITNISRIIENIRIKAKINQRVLFCIETKSINKIKKIDMRFVNFIYNGNVAKNNIPLAQVINEDDRKRNVLSILVNKNDFDEITHNSITCPKCFCEAEMSWEGYKAKLKCPNGHFFNNLSVREFEKTQELELSKIVCDICKETKFIDCNPENFKRCSKCKINLCQDCEEEHLKSDNKKKRKKKEKRM